MRKLSVITVCYEAADDLRKTMDSVLSQTSCDFEYLIQDGGSTDSTQEIIAKYRPYFFDRGIPFSFFTEKDQGIYDAMNKAAARATGEWLLYMNAGDTFAATEVLTQIWRQEIPTEAVILYGDTIELEADGDYLWHSELKGLDIRCSLCHQSVLIRTSWMRENPYDLRYRIGADYDFFLKTRAAGKLFFPVDLIISRITKDGYSNRNEKQRVLETEEIKENYGLSNRHSWNYRWICVQAEVKQWIIDYLPLSVVRRLRQMRRKMRKRGQKIE